MRLVFGLTLLLALVSCGSQGAIVVTPPPPQSVATGSVENGAIIIVGSGAPSATQH